MLNHQNCHDITAEKGMNWFSYDKDNLNCYSSDGSDCWGTDRVNNTSNPWSTHEITQRDCTGKFDLHQKISGEGFNLLGGGGWFTRI